MTLTIKAQTNKDASADLGTLQHRHFAAIAAIIKEIDGDRERPAHHFAHMLARTNPRFDPSRFLRACGVV